MRKAALSGQAQRWSTAFLSIELSHTKSEEGNAASPNFFLRKKKKATPFLFRKPRPGVTRSRHQAKARLTNL